MSIPELTRWTRDIRDLIGIRTAFGVGLSAAFCLAGLGSALSNPAGVRHMAVVVAAWVILAAAVAGVVWLPGDPLPTRFALPLTLAAPVSAVLVVSQLPVPPANAGQLWFHMMMIAYLVFMCVRGAVGCAWLGIITASIVVVVWTGVTDQGFVTGLVWTLPNLPPLLMATVFTYKVRPVARTISALRYEANQRAAQQAAALAASDERDRRLADVDALVRTMLEHIASGTPLTAADREECLLLDAELRDGIRGSSLVDHHVIAAARAARQRGVCVTLLDDGGLDAGNEVLAGIVRSQLCAMLDAAQSGSVAARVLPPGRPILATVLARDGERENRIEVDLMGSVVAEGVVGEDFFSVSRFLD
ncbi:hypothetical protein ONR57_12985 [Hoyosella sp. YIM 151337]|uniref:hypothetical protein n=1 Tax=Hoyosella sp. YIM 151337 TaxID=2992742 RepID=UPI00223697D6|nr:hypothetical protein [Hoyosella sp. YIM 151337]MCW4354215.1 hypothetical protein [Hoyosella sp. YIM 151337]